MLVPHLNLLTKSCIVRHRNLGVCNIDRSPFDWQATSTTRHSGTSHCYVDFYQLAHHSPRLFHVVSLLTRHQTIRDLLRGLMIVAQMGLAQNLPEGVDLSRSGARGEDGSCGRGRGPRD